MVAWLAVAKMVAPHVASIVTAALPAFTTRKSEHPEDELELAQQQIAELQHAVTRNDAHIRELAEQLQTTALALEKVGLQAQQRMRALYFTSGAAVVAAAVALWLAVSA